MAHILISFPAGMMCGGCIHGGDWLAWISLLPTCYQDGYWLLRLPTAKMLSVVRVITTRWWNVRLLEGYYCILLVSFLFVNLFCFLMFALG